MMTDAIHIKKFMYALNYANGAIELYIFQQYFSLKIKALYFVRKELFS